MLLENGRGNCALTVMNFHLSFDTGIVEKIEQSTISKMTF